MFVRMDSGQSSVEALNRVIQIWNEKAIPLMQSVKGYRGGYLLTDKELGKVISVTFWENEEDVIAYESSVRHQKQINMYQDTIWGEHSHQRYEVSGRNKIGRLFTAVY